MPDENSVFAMSKRAIPRPAALSNVPASEVAGVGAGVDASDSLGDGECVEVAKVTLFARDGWSLRW